MLWTSRSAAHDKPQVIQHFAVFDRSIEPSIKLLCFSVNAAEPTKFSAWTEFSDLSDVSGNGLPGVYLLAHFSETPPKVAESTSKT